MRPIKNVKRNNWRLCTIILISIILLTAVASASVNNKISVDDQGSNDPSVKEEKIVGTTNDGKDFLVKKVIVHYDSKSKSAKAPGSGSGCYKLMGVKWTTFPINYVINPTNSGLNESDVISALSISSSTWDAVTSRVLFGAYQIDSNAQWNDGARPDYKNSLVFGNNDPDPGVIAVTTTWYTLFGKKIVDYDISFETDYAWGDAAINATKMDLQNIATHETGHGLGLSDLYNSCTEETMYGYSSYGETKKQTLNNGDISGLQRMYGS
jgi:hypothetical protein